MDHLCACGCGKEVTWNKWSKKWNRFLKGHRLSKPKYIPGEIGPLCACGCGEHVSWSIQNKSWNKFVLYHGNRGKPYWETQEESRLCKCGCGLEVKAGCSFVNAGHANRSGRYWKLQDDLTNPKQCACGCGKIVPPGSRFIAGHHKGNLSKNPKKPQLCACGCGQFTKPGNSYIHGHQFIGRSHTEETKIKIGKKNSTVTKEKRIHLSKAAIQRELLKSEKLGLTQSKYCDAWEDPEYSDDLRKDACEICGITNMMCMKLSSMRLSTHHTYGKDRCAPDEIQTFCTSCHMRLESKLRERGKDGRFL